MMRLYIKIRAAQKMPHLLCEIWNILNNGMNYLKNISLLLVLASLGTGCASLSGAESKQNLAKLKYGMSQPQVLNLLGTPDSVLSPNTVEDKWVYEFRKEDKRGHNIFIEFKNGALTKTGELSGREVAASEEYRKPGICTHRASPDMIQESTCIK
jgi:outer membrane protein assembly factor BamE (lipoprotein component of BamABCDE complex)